MSATQATPRTRPAHVRTIAPATWAVLGLTALAAAIRFATLGHQSFWLDESYALGNIRFHSFSGMLGWMRVHEQTPPLYFVLARGWIHLFGSGEVGLRSLSALFGTATVPVVYLAGAAMRSRRAGLIAAAFTALSPLTIWYSQEARNYALLLFLAAVAFLGFVRILRGAGTLWLSVWWVSCALMLGTHWFSVFYVAGLAAVLLFRVRRAPVIAAAAGLGVVELLLLPYALDMSAHAGFNGIRSIPVLYRVAQVPSQFGWGPVEGGFGPWIVGAIVVLLTAAAVRFSNRISRDSALVLVVSVGLPVVIALVGVDYLTPRYLLPSFVPLALVWAAPLARGRTGVFIAVAACVALAAASIGLLASSDLERPDWSAAAKVLGPAPVARAVVAPHEGLPLRVYLTPGELDHGVAPSRPGNVDVAEIAVVGVTAHHRQGCWWGGTCQLPSRLLPRLDPPAPGFRLVRQEVTGRFHIAVFRAPSPRHVALAKARLYDGRDSLGLISFVEPVSATPSAARARPR